MTITGPGDILLLRFGAGADGGADLQDDDLQSEN